MAFADALARRNQLDPAWVRKVVGQARLLPQISPLFAPNVNSFRRMRPDTDAPINVQWGSDNRSCGLRIPISDSKNRRIENRLPGADANPYVALAMTLANPTKDQDGDILIITGNGKAAHTVTYTAGVGNGGASYDVFTFATGANNTVSLIAANAIWNPCPSLIGGTATAITATIA